jgi:hypothetical protein
MPRVRSFRPLDSTIVTNAGIGLRPREDVSLDYLARREGTTRSEIVRRYIREEMMRIHGADWAANLPHIAATAGVAA